MQKVQRYRSDLRRIEGEIFCSVHCLGQMMVFKVQIKTDMAVDDLENKLFGRLPPRMSTLHVSRSACLRRLPRSQTPSNEPFLEFVYWQPQRRLLAVKP